MRNKGVRLRQTESKPRTVPFSGTGTGVSVIVCAYNEEDNIVNAMRNVVRAMRKARSPYEILVIIDGSSDKTRERAKREAEKDKNIRVIDLGQNMGLGYAFRKGIELATREYLSVFPGDNDMDPDSLTDLVRKKDTADLVISYLGKSDTRGLLRKITSLMYVDFVNRLFKMKIQYYNGPFICKTKKLQKVKLISTGFTIFAELKIRLIKSGCTLVEIPFIHAGRVHGKSKAIRFKTILNSIFSTILIWRDI